MLLVLTRKGGQVKAKQVVSANENLVRPCPVAARPLVTVTWNLTSINPHLRGSEKPYLTNVKIMLNPYSAKGLGDRLYATLHKMPVEVDYSFCLFLKSKTSSLYTSRSHIIHSTARSKPSLLNHFLFTTGCYKTKYTIQFLWMACISRLATAILSGETELALGTIRVRPECSVHYKSMLRHAIRCTLRSTQAVP